MGKGSGLAVVALILALGGLGIGGYMLITNMTTPGVHRSYYDERTTNYTSGSEDTWYDIPDISINFQVDAGESVHFLFTCRANLVASSGLVYMHFVLNVDDFRVVQSQATVGHNEGATINTISFSVALQFTNTTMSAGVHTVVVEHMRECSGFIDNCALFVQTYS